MGPRIYNLFPLLCGPVSSWSTHLPRIAAMDFDWVFLNPFQCPGFSGSLYAIKDYYSLNRQLRGGTTDHDLRPVAEFVADAKARGISVMMDLVINHTARDSILVAQHPEWFARDEDGSVRSPYAIDPDDPTKRTVWGDLAEIRYDDPATRPDIAEYWMRVIGRYLDLGFAGFRCDAAYMVPTAIWRPLVSHAKGRAPDARFFAETLGCTPEQVEALADARFDYLFNSVKWWDLQAGWALDQHERYRHIAPSVGFPESHDTARLAVDALSAGVRQEQLRTYYLLRYVLAAWFSTGVMMPIGFEYGFRHRLDVVNTRPEDWETQQFDITTEIASINRMKASCPALNEEGPQRRLSGSGRALALLKRTNDHRAASLFVANPDLDTPVDIDLRRILDGTEISSQHFRVATPQNFNAADSLTFRLQPLEWQVLQTI